jgi:hypothetical protein
MATEAFAQIASLLCAGYRVTAVEDEALEKPFKYYRGQPTTFHLTADARPAEDGQILVATQLKSLIQPKPELPAVEKVHFRASVRMRRKAPAKPKVSFKRPVHRSMPIVQESIYKVYFHGPAYKVLERVQVENDQAIGLMPRDLPPNAAPEGAEALMAPRLVELCFQTAAIWEVAQKRTLALPMALRLLKVYRAEKDAAGHRVYAVVDAVDGGDRFDARVVDETGRVYVELLGYESVTFEENQELPT